MLYHFNPDFLWKKFSSKHYSKFPKFANIYLFFEFMLFSSSYEILHSTYMNLFQYRIAYYSFTSKQNLSFNCHYFSL